ncbi:MAG: hypothetical protein ACLUAI_04225, partial [Lachnospira sp.]
LISTLALIFISSLYPVSRRFSTPVCFYIFNAFFDTKLAPELLSNRKKCAKIALQKDTAY